MEDHQWLLLVVMTSFIGSNTLAACWLFSITFRLPTPAIGASESVPPTFLYPSLHQHQRRPLLATTYFPDTCREVDVREEFQAEEIKVLTAVHGLISGDHPGGIHPASLRTIMHVINQHIPKRIILSETRVSKPIIE